MTRRPRWVEKQNEKFQRIHVLRPAQKAPDARQACSFVCAAVCILVLAGIITLIISLFDKKGKQDDSLEPEQTSNRAGPAAHAGDGE